MSLTFSRRSFLKYTAVAAVAVAGSSLLTGCYKMMITKLPVRSMVKSPSCRHSPRFLVQLMMLLGKLTFDFSVKCGRGNPMRVEQFLLLC